MRKGKIMKTNPYKPFELPAAKPSKGLAVLALALTLATTTALAQRGVLPPTATPYGRSYTTWSEAHWQWLFAQSADHHPLAMDGNVDLSLGQPAGHVWFLGGTFAITTVGTTNFGIAHRTGTIPAGTALFFPLIDSEDSVAEEKAGIGCYPAGTCTSETCLRNCVEGLLSNVTGVFCTIDGVPVANLQNYQFISSLFTWGPLPANNLFGDPTNFPAGLTTQAVSDGFFVMVAPLSAGSHTIHFGGTISGSPTFVQDITYHITVN